MLKVREMSTLLSLMPRMGREPTQSDVYCDETTSVNSNIKVFPKCFTKFAKFSDKNICHYSKRVQTCHLLCKRPGWYHSTSKIHVRDRIFKLSAIHASAIFRFPEFAEFSESSALFRKTPLVTMQLDDNKK